MHDLANGRLPNSFSILFPNKSVSHIITRNSRYNIHQERPINKFTENLPKHQFRKVCSNLDSILKGTKSRIKLKRLVKTKLLNGYLNSEYINCRNPICPECLNN